MSSDEQSVAQFQRLDVKAWSLQHATAQHMGQFQLACDADFTQLFGTTSRDLSSFHRSCRNVPYLHTTEAREQRRTRQPYTPAGSLASCRQLIRSL
jgi:hypothetical protein